MAYTVQQVVTEARSILQDLDTPYRYTDDQCVAAVNYAVYGVQRLRPDLFWGSYPITQTTLVITDAFPLSDIYVPLCATFVAGWAELRDDDYAEDQRAALLLSAFKPGLQGG